jgi:hypothetical protein
MLAELSGECWSDFMSRMVSQFDQLVEAKPTCVEDVVQELTKRAESVTFFDVLRDSVPEMRKAKPETLPVGCRVTATMLRCKDLGSFARKAKSVMTQCYLQPKHLRFWRTPI